MKTFWIFSGDSHFKATKKGSLREQAKWLNNSKCAIILVVFIDLEVFAMK